MMDIKDILEQRELTYGRFSDIATKAHMITELIADDLERNSGLDNSYSAKKVALEMIAMKIARIVSGDSNHIDNWKDIAGYALLVAQELEDMELDAS